MNEEIVNMIKDVYKIADDIDKYSCTNNIRELIRKDMIDFLLFIAYIDRKITFKETGMIAYYFDFKNLTPEKAMKLIGNIKSNFEKIIPDSMKIMVQYSKNLFRNGHESLNNQPAIVLYLLYKRIGNAAVYASGSPIVDEYEALGKYLLMLENYIKNELEKDFLEDQVSIFDESIACSSIDYSSPGTTDGYYFAEIEEYASLGIYKEEHYTLEEFIQLHPSYKKGIEIIGKEFIRKGYEKFLTIENMYNRKSTEEYILHAGDLVPNRYICNFIEQFNDIDFTKDVVFLFPESYASNYFEAQEICKKAKILRKIRNIFPNEDKVHWIGVFEKTDIENIIIMFHVIYSGVMKDNYGGYKLLGFGLPWYADNLLFHGTVLKSPWLPDYLAHFQGYCVQRNNPHIIMQIRRNIDYILEQGYFNNELEIYRNLYQILMPFLNKWFTDVEECISNCNLNIDWKTRRMEIKSKLVADGVIKSKWKHERMLYDLIKKLYPDAIYQYHSSWLGRQSLDIYIPQFAIGIEYQGIQHYEAVDFFGGKDGLKKRMELDSKKKELCIKNGVTLIEWNYNLEPTQNNVKKMIGETLKIS